jgi:hypothetical protein
MKTLDYKINPKNAKEGWDIFFSEGSHDGDYQIQCIDDMGVFKNDLEAIAFVYDKAIQGSKRHRKALASIAMLNPRELRNIFK